MEKHTTKETQQENEKIKEQLDFESNEEFLLASQNCVAAFDHLEIIRDGKVIWSQKAYDFLEDECPNCANPSLWENARCNHQTGLFRVSDQIFQLRGFDMANLTLVLTPNNNWIVFDTLMSIECSRAAIEFADLWFNDHGYPTVEQNLAGIVISHSHVDHFGGIKGIFPDFTVDPSIPIYAPSGFTEAAISENLMVGKAMGRRAVYQYGSILEKSPFGSLSVGIGQGQSTGTISFELPTYEITENEKILIDGLGLEFQLTPGTEAPAEMNTYIPAYEALWMAENCTCTMHNLYTLRGAQVRDGKSWAKYLLEAQQEYGKKAKILFHAHTWPRYATIEEPDTINSYLLSQARLYKGIHDKSLKAINEGYTINELYEQVNLPKELTEKWYLRPYYGTIAHNSKAVYQKYIGWYDSNPVNLNPLTPEFEAKQMVKYMGGAEAILEKAHEDYESGNYKWAAKIANVLIFAEPENKEARALCRRSLTQLGYQAESGAWRNEYLTGAAELRDAYDPAKRDVADSSELSAHMNGEMLLDYLSIHTVTSEKEQKGFVTFTDDWQMKDGRVQPLISSYLIDYWKGILTYSPMDENDSFPVIYEGERLVFLQQMLDPSGEPKEWSALFHVENNDYFHIVEP
ncbi:alkyl sulfatase dimerization domain-containing protein [Enterococcus sp. ZJ1668]|uniref:alkyl/aryl-sulfatase n=1 Tax=Enterococcus sp. ZJ1668 TaxID=2709402 RepID=UPI0013EDFB14|nr:alkyl sulfatase dimerization domain-containing protein [Enterococcus sp. ZJ1668]